MSGMSVIIAMSGIIVMVVIIAHESWIRCYSYSP